MKVVKNTEDVMSTEYTILLPGYDEKKEVTSIRDIDKYDSIRYLKFSSNKRNYDNRALPKNLKELHLEGDGITTLPDLPVELNALLLTGTKITDISRISHLKNLNELHIWNGNLEGNLDLSTITSLRIVSMNDNKMRSVKLSPEVEEFDCSGNQIEELILPEKLKRLDITGNNIKKLVANQNLESLVCSNVTDIVGISSLIDITIRDTSIRTLKDMPSLKILNMYLVDLSNIYCEELPSLIEINAESCKGCLDPILNRCSSLKELHINGSNVNYMPYIETLKMLSFTTYSSINNISNKYRLKNLIGATSSVEGQKGILFS